MTAPPQSKSLDESAAPPRPPAALLRRLAALAYDALLLAALIFVFTLLLVIVRNGEIGSGTLWFDACLVAIALLFCGVFWTHGGQTLGMKAWRIRVIAADGGPVTWKLAVIRFFASWLALLPAGLGYWWAWLDRERRCWHDRLSGTRVIHEPKSAATSRG